MKKQITIALLILIHYCNYAQVNTAEIKAKIAELDKQKSGIESEISKLQASIPTPIWNYKGNFALNFGQSLLGNDWSTAYGANSNLNLQGVAHFEANYLKARHQWDNGFDGKFGFVKNFDDNNTGVNTNIAKNSDLLQVYSKYLYDLKKGNLKVGFGMNFLSQFTKTYDQATGNFLISDFLAPGTLDLAPGIQWEPLPYLKIFFAPAMGRLTFVNNDTIISRAAENRFGNDVNEKLRTELGAKADIVFEKEVVKNLVIRSRAQLFNNYTRSDVALTNINSSKSNVDVNWQNDIFYKLTKSIALNFGFQWIYDDDVRVKNAAVAGGFNKAQFQWRQNFGLGFVAGF